MRIKDPSFLIIKEGYLFYFGKVSIRALIECTNDAEKTANNERLCSLDESRSNLEDIGIKTYYKNDISYFEPGINCLKVYKYNIYF